MNHYTWTYVAGAGRNTKVGLFHGNQSGHVLIYVGSQVTVIDFKVFESKEYTFFIDDELCRIKLERRGEKMFYNFEIDKKTDTPLNRARWALEKKHLRQLLLLLGIFAVVIAGFVAFSSKLRQVGHGLSETDAILVRQGVETVGRVSIRPGQPSPVITYHFVAGNEALTATHPTDSQEVMILPNGMPLESGDEFVVRYAPKRPEVSQIYFGRPTERQLENYLQRAASKYETAAADTTGTDVACLVRAVLAFEGIDGLADIYFLDATPADSPGHNQETFRKLCASLVFQKALDDCQQQ